MEKTPRQEPAFEKERVMRSVISRYIAIPAMSWSAEISRVVEAGLPTNVMVPAEQALDLGIGPDGKIPEDVHDGDYDQLMLNSIDPELN